MTQRFFLSMALTAGLSVSAMGNTTAFAGNEPDSLKSAPENWFNLDHAANGVHGVSTEKAYEFLRSNNKKSTKVIVAVIDSGIDTEHEDLADIMWVNEDEIPGNGIDDDNNGYIDDIHGWNFIGGKDGENVDKDTYELTREYVRLSKKYDSVDADKLSKKQKKEFEYFTQIKEDFLKQKGDMDNGLNRMDMVQHMFNRQFKLMEAYLDMEDFYLADLDSVNSTDPVILQSKELLSSVMAETGGAGSAELKGFIMNDIQKGIDYYGAGANFGLNPEFDPRATVGDDYSNLNERHYGNNIYDGPDASHGTHVGGIIGAIRNNRIGMDGVADNVAIMTVRAVPDGDERDKDVANAIRYAVDNGAQVINMSFGKSYSPDKAVVDAAIRYAVERDVVLVHAAGNDSKNVDTGKNFPNVKNSKSNRSTWIEVGASTWKSVDEIAAPFSNYGKKYVDVFAPGYDIYSTVPGSKYDSYNGTSMASPVVAGIAALLRSYYPELSAKQVKNIIMKSTVRFEDSMVLKPGMSMEDEDGMVKFGELSKTAGVVNAYNAVKLADKTKGKRKKM